MSAEENKAIVRRWFDLIDVGNITEAAQLLTPDILIHMPGAMPDIYGVEAWKDHADVVLRTFDNPRHTVEDILAEGDRVAARYSFSGTHKGEFEGLAPTGNQIEFSCILIAGIADGRMKEVWGSWDNQDFMQQLGAVPTLGQGKE